MSGALEIDRKIGLKGERVGNFGPWRRLEKISSLMRTQLGH